MPNPRGAPAPRHELMDRYTEHLMKPLIDVETFLRWDFLPFSTSNGQPLMAARVSHLHLSGQGLSANHLPRLHLER